MVPANEGRLDFVWQNQSGNTIQIVLQDGQGGTPTILLYDPGIKANAQGASDSLSALGIRHVGPILICGPAASQVAAREY